MTPTPEAVERARDCARFYQRCGWNALPSRMDRKGPALDSYTEFWDTEIPAWVHAEWATTNIQVMTGVRWGLCVVDCDGDDARATFRLMRNFHGEVGPVPTWVSVTGGGGWHYWFSLPGWLDELPSKRLWGQWDTWGGPKHEGDWLKHREVRLLADLSLVIAPPSTHVKTGREYAWMDGRSPREFHRPATAPTWLLEMPAVVVPKFTEVVPPFSVVRPPVKSPVRPAGGFVSREDVLAAIPDKIALARSWGLRIASSRPNAKGWFSCHAIDRVDEHPSAGISVESGTYSERREGTVLSLFDLAVALGQYVNWETAKDDLAARFLPRAHTRLGTRSSN